MRVLYDIIALFVSLVFLPVYICKRKFHRGFLSRLGIGVRAAGPDGPIWVHAVSVGETMSVRQLVNGLRIRYPDKRFVISTVTPTGNRIAQSLAREGDRVLYLPLDFSFIVRRVISRIKPSICIIAETEFWPNLITLMGESGIPVVIVNGRISDSSFNGYRRVKFLLRPVFNAISLFCMQTEDDARKLSALGVQRSKIIITGNMKFDTLEYLDVASPGPGGAFHLDTKEKLLVAGSTHRGEEAVIAQVYKRLSEEYPEVRLLIAPRHPERGKEVEKILLQQGLPSIRLSGPAGPGGGPGEKRPVYILDTVGELVSFYNIADIVFVGGSLIKKGGHNILEPASLGKPVVFGPHMFNFRDIADLFLAHNASIRVRNKEELFGCLQRLLGNPQEMRDLGGRAKELVLVHQGATLKNLECIYTAAFQGLWRK